jgi:hypothetical protein
VVVVFARDDFGAAVVPLPMLPDVRTTHSAGELLEWASAARVIVLCLDDLRAAASASLIISVQRKARFAALLIVAPYSRENARALKDVVVEDVIWADEAPRRLPTAVEQVVARSSSSQFARAVLQGRALRPATSTALLKAASAHPPWKSLHDVARAAFCSLRTLESEFVTAFGGGLRTPRRFLAIARLLWASDQLRNGASRSAVAADLQIDVRTLERRARELIGLRPKELRDALPADLLLRSIAAWSAPDSGSA